MVKVKLFSGKEGHRNRRIGQDSTGTELFWSANHLRRKIQQYEEQGLFPSFFDAEGNKLDSAEAAIFLLQKEQENFAINFIGLGLVLIALLFFVRWLFVQEIILAIPYLQ